MPFLGGFQVLARLQETRRESFLPVMVTTGSAERDLCLRALEAGAQDFVKKPFDGAELAGRLRNLVRLRLMYEAQRASRSHVEAQVEERTAKRSEEHTSELQSLMRNPYAVFCMKKKKHIST